ncbi:MAG: aminotransferase class V-fold PLP-dependent enzyme [Clostridia bacterium]|nr:aminotransferase class V-fold PLP-dependent enzyme [Clostridia bacterium]
MIYFDNAATSYPKPLSVCNAVYGALMGPYANPGRSGHPLSLAAGERIFEVREAAAEFFGALPEEVVFTKNATEALNVAIKGCYALSGKNEIIISDLEHNAVYRPVCKLEKGGATVKIFNTDGSPEQIVKSFEALCTKNTALAVFTHASNVTGKLLPVSKLCDVAKRYGITTVIDASQTAGLADIDLGEIKADFLCTAGHKSLFGPMGTGLLIARGGADTLIEGGTGVLSVEKEMPSFTPERFEGGTLNFPGIIGLGAGLTFILKKGRKTISEHEQLLLKECALRLEKISGVTLYLSPRDKALNTLSFNIKGYSSGEAAAVLSKSGFCLRSGLHCAPLAHSKLGTLSGGTLRASFGFFNTENEILELVRAVSELKSK